MKTPRFQTQTQILEQGTFCCPSCRIEGRYEHARSARVLSVLERAVLRCSAFVEQVQCKSCGKVHAPEVLESWKHSVQFKTGKSTTEKDEAQSHAEYLAAAHSALVSEAMMHHLELNGRRMMRLDANKQLRMFALELGIFESYFTLIFAVATAEKRASAWDDFIDHHARSVYGSHARHALRTWRLIQRNELENSQREAGRTLVRTGRLPETVESCVEAQELDDSLDSSLQRERFNRKIIG